MPDDPTPTPTPTPEPEPKGPDLAKVVESLIAKHGDGNAALRVLLAENYGYRDQIRDLKAKAPADGALILTGDDAKAWDKYRTLGKPDELATVKREHGERGTELTGLKRESELRTVAEKTGVDFDVLKTIAGQLDFAGTVKVKDPKTQKESEVVAVKDGEADPVAFDEYAAKHWAKFLPSLRPNAGEPQKQPGSPNGARPRPLPAQQQPATTQTQPARAPVRL